GLGGFGDKDKPASPGKLFGEILKEGASVGVHIIVWCNSYNNVDRALGRQLLREFELRVVFQMSSGDSSNLIDNPAASRLGPNRALLYRDDQGTTEKFRPYGRPSDEWLTWINHQLNSSEESPVKEEPEELDALDDISDLTIS
ncbi:MAG: hypothetical protein KDA84_18615, partial [Planctomycetaceae bacterium]|nr:hypothetical protein [Planctomycetaceae bacterium]